MVQYRADEKNMNHELLVAYRQCFHGGSGRVVLTDLLMEGGFFDDDLKTGEEIAVENFVKKILHKMGVYDKNDLGQQSRFVGKIFELPFESGKQND